MHPCKKTRRLAYLLPFDRYWPENYSQEWDPSIFDTFKVNNKTQQDQKDFQPKRLRKSFPDASMSKKN